MKLGIFALVSLAATACWVRAQDEAAAFNPLGRDLPMESMEKQIRIQVEWIEVSHEDYTALLAEDDPANPEVYRPANHGRLRMEVSELIEGGDAKILDTMHVVARSGQRAKAESILEYIYPTEYDPALIGGANTGESKENEEPQPARYGNHLPTPTAFETRNVGSTLEVDPQIGPDGVTIDMSLTPELVYLADESEWGEYESEDGELEMKMPSFYAMKVTTQVTLISGQYLMMGATSPFDTKTGMADYDRKVLVFVKADMLVTGMPEKAPQAAPAQEPEKQAVQKPEKPGAGKTKGKKQNPAKPQP